MLSKVGRRGARVARQVKVVKVASLPDVGISVNNLLEETQQRYLKDELRSTHFPSTEVMRNESKQSSIQTQGKRTNRGKHLVTHRLFIAGVLLYHRV